MALVQARVVEIEVERQAGGFRVGSGYLLDGNLVLTSRHVIIGTGNQDDSKSIRGATLPTAPGLENPLPAVPPFSMRVVWQNEKADVCLLKVVETASLPVLQDRVPWGMFKRTGAMACRACGFPHAAQTEESGITTRDSAGLRGHLDPDGDVKSGRFSFDADNAPRAEESPGFSGSAVFANGLLVGVLTSVLAQYEERRFKLWPVERLVREFPDFCQLTGIELQQLQAADAPLKDPGPGTGGARRCQLSLHLLPPANKELFVGRSGYFTQLDDAWLKGQTCVVQFVAAGGVGKSALVWNWVQKFKREYAGEVSSAIDWSFYNQGTHEPSTDSSKFRDVAIAHFRQFGHEFSAEALRDDVLSGRAIGEAFLKYGGLLILDGVEPLQESPTVYGGRLKDQRLGALVQLICASGPPATGEPKRLLILTTRWAIPEVDGVGVVKEDLNALDDNEGVELLQRFRLPERKEALHLDGVRDDPEQLKAELVACVREYQGHSLSLVLLASFLIRLFRGDLRKRHEIPPLGKCQNQGDPYRHARRILNGWDLMLAEERWPLARPCRQVLWLVGLFDRPAPLKLLEMIRAKPAIADLTDEFTVESPDLLFEEAISELRELRFLSLGPLETSGESLDAHPSIREHFGSSFAAAHPRETESAHRRIFASLCEGPEFPDSVEDMAPLFQAVMHGCKAGRYRDALQVYTHRLMRDGKSYAIREGGVAPVLSALSHFFEGTAWGSPVQTGSEAGQELTMEDQVFLLTQAGKYLTATRGYSVAEVEKVFEAALARCQLGENDAALRTALKLEKAADALLDDPKSTFAALAGLWRHHFMTGDTEAGLTLANELFRRASDRAHVAMGYRVQVTTRLFLAGFTEISRFVEKGIQEGHLVIDIDEAHRAEALTRAIDFVVDVPASSYTYWSLALWHLGKADTAIGKSRAALDRGNWLGHGHTRAVTLYFDGWLQQCLRDYDAALARATQLADVSYASGLDFWLDAGRLQQAWAKGMIARRGNDPAGLAAARDEMIGRVKQWDSRTGATLFLPLWQILLAELHLAAGQWKEGHAVVKDATRYAEDEGQLLWLPDLSLIEGQLWLASSDPAGRTLAEACLRKVIGLAREHGSKAMELRAALHLAKFLQTQGQFEEGRALLATIYGQFTEGFQTSDLIEAKIFLEALSEK